MNIYIPAMDRPCPAELALATQRMNYEVIEMENDYNYATLLYQLWCRQEGFVLIEHDIVPWPGAIDDLLKCNSHYCGYQYPNQGLWHGGLGCVKFTTEFVRAFPNLNQGWLDTHWSNLDAKVAESIRLHTEHSYYHVHTPGVAHLKPLTNRPPVVIMEDHGEANTPEGP